MADLGNVGHVAGQVIGGQIRRLVNADLAAAWPVAHVVVGPQGLDIGAQVLGELDGSHARRPGRWCGAA
jgi:hypothetical protein